jgi:AAA family ATP:ADP antiporter
MGESVSLQPAAGKRGWLDRVLTILAPVKAGEGASALLLAANVFLLLFAYYILKTVRDALILTEAGAEVKAYSGAGQALLLLFLVPAYGAFASRVNRIRLISWVTLFFISNLAVFALLGGRGIPVGIPFFFWVGIFNVLVIAQFWAFANDVYTQEQGKRLFAIVGIGSALGAWLGALAAEKLFEAMGPYQLMSLSAVLLCGCIGASHIVHRRESNGDSSQAAAAHRPLGTDGGFQLVWRHRYLLLIALLIVLLNVVNTTGEFLLDKLVVTEAARLFPSGSEEQTRTFIGQFKGDFFGWVNLLTLLLQLFLVSRLFRYIGVRGALFVLPGIALGGYSLLIFAPLLSIVRIAKILENSTDYSIQNTARHALFLPTSREAKYKAKAAIDTFFWRTGDMLQGVVVFVGTQLAFSISSFAALNLVFVGFWLLVVMLIYREHKKITAEQPRPSPVEVS